MSNYHEYHKEFSRCTTNGEKFDLIRRIYREQDEDIRKYNGMVCPYFLDWMCAFTPIEELAWCCIRDWWRKLQMFPQYPVGRYFIDFGDPIRRIGLECDGKQWHDTAKDTARDAELLEIGWQIYRVTGAECYRDVRDPGELEYDGYEVSKDDRHRWYMMSVDGLLESIAVYHCGAYTLTPWYIASLRAHTLQDRKIEGWCEYDEDDE